MNRVTALAIALTAAVLLLILILGQCDQLRTAATRARVEQGQTGALANSASDAVDTTAAAGQREAASEQLTRENEKEIRNAPGASDPINPAVRDAGLRSLCRRAAYRDSERCRLLQPAPR